MRATERASRGSRRQPGRPGGSLALALFGALWGVAGASAQPARAGAGSAPPERIVVSFQQRSRFEKQTHPFRLNALGATRILAFRTRLQVYVRRLAGPVGVFVELQDSRSTGSDEPLVVLARHVNHLDIKQVLLRLGSTEVLGSSLSGGLQVGRFTLDLGRRRLSARNRMRNTTNAFDGVSGWLRAEDGSSLQAFLTQPLRLDPYELDRSESRRVFWGSILSVHRWRGSRPRPTRFGSTRAGRP